MEELYLEKTKKMLLASQNFSYGSSGSAWKSPGVNPTHYIDSDSLVNVAKLSEKGKFHFVFLADHPSLRDDLTNHAPSSTLDPIVIASQVIRETEKIGVVLTQSTSFNHPYTVARQLKALDVLSKGRIGWNAVTTNDPEQLPILGKALQIVLYVMNVPMNLLIQFKPYGEVGRKMHFN